MKETKKTILVQQISKGKNFNLLQVVTDTGEALQISDWNKLPLKEKNSYLFEIKENNGYLNLQSAIAEDGTKIEHNIKNTIKTLKETIQNLTKELDSLEEVV